MIVATLAGNRYMYMNRLRHDDFLDLYSECGHDLLATKADVKPELLAVINNDAFTLDGRFAAKEIEILCTTGAWLVSRKSPIVAAGAESGA